MRSQLDVRLGVQIPRIVHLPPDVHSLAAAEEAIELADAYGLADGHPLDESQRFTLRAALGERVDGSWAATQVGDFKGRQAGGKSDTIAARELAGLILYGERLIIHTAHEFATANESFLRLVAVFENWDDLRDRVQRILYGNGTQSIVLLSGQRILYKARTGGAGRGFSKAALVVYDEAQHLQSEHVAASGPARLAVSNSQSWYAGSGGLASSKMAWRLRRRALAGSAGRLAYVEGTAELVSVDAVGRVASSRPDPLDRDNWAQANPGLGRWVTEESLESLYEELGPELFARECMCVWDPEFNATDDAVVDPAIWASLFDPRSLIVSHQCIALDVSPDRKWAAFGAAGRRADGKLHVEMIDRQPPRTEWVLGRALELAHYGPLRIQKGSPAESLVAPLREAGVTVTEMSKAEHAQALGQFLDAVAADGLRHLGQPPLDDALRAAQLQVSGDVEVWGRRSSRADVCVLVAVTLALGGVPSVEHRPSVYEERGLTVIG